MTQHVDVTVIGSGFAGSILAWILARQGLGVALIDRARHPRFAIGESSTPIADLILRRLGNDYQLKELSDLSTWGSWQRSHPDLGCGRKRGFSYFVHHQGREYEEADLGQSSLLVAASPSDDVADTHWYRADVDTLFWRQAVSSGAMDLTGHRVIGIHRARKSGLHVVCQGQTEVKLATDWVVDATGQTGVFTEHFAIDDMTSQLLTRTHAIYGHYRGVGTWKSVAESRMLRQDLDPFDPDDAAQHHLLESGWVWMLRFNNGITSVGYTTPSDRPLPELEQLARSYPTLGTLMHDGQLVAPPQGCRRTTRLQRCLDPVVDAHCLMLPTAAVTLDPLHSTGIAHALAGVERLIPILTADDATNNPQRVAEYRRALLEETRLLDRLVHTAYETMSDFDRFTAACMLYFAGAIRCEERYQRGESPSHLWNADDPAFVSFVDWARDQILGGSTGWYDRIRSRLEPWNTAGLMDPEVRNRYAHTATK
jgi:FADH2 O2-dependent halogenase